MKIFSMAVLLLCSFMSFSAYSASSSSCENYSSGKCYYNSTDAVAYAKKYALSSTYFPEYQSYGGNCTNFVSQAILAGLIGSSSKNIFNQRSEYWADKNRGCDYCWYYGNKVNGVWQKGSAWTGAQELYDYANSNLDSYWGMHFDHITSDGPTSYLETKKVQTGDIVFADWEGDGHIDHSMIVIQKKNNYYSGIYVAYQNSEDYDSQERISLQSINGRNVVFHVYRPTFYRN